MNLKQAFEWNVGTCRLDDKGESQVVRAARDRVPMRGTGADQFVVATKSGNADGAKGLNCSVFLGGQP